MALSIMLSLFYLASCFLVSGYNKGKLPFKPSTKFYFALSFVFVSALCLRLYLGYFTVGFETDLNTFKAWGSLVNEKGFKDVYSADIFIDYPPGYLYILSLLDHLKNAFNLSFYDNAYTLIMKMPSIISDMVSAIIVYILSKKKIGEISGALISSLYLFCPAVLINSAVWGQADSFTALLLLISVWLFYNDKITFAAIVYGLGVLSKPQMLIFAPLFLFGLIYRKKYLKLILGVLSSLVVILLLSLPFSKGFDFTWLIEKYISTIDYYSFYTINAYNFWALIGFNWKALPAGGLGLTALNVLGPLVAVILTGILLFKKKIKDDYFVNSKYRASYFAAPALLMFTVYIFAVKMHERYLFPALLFILLTYIFTHDKRFLIVFAASSFAHFLNVSYVLYLNNAYVAPNAPELIFLSSLHVASYIYFLYVLYSVFKKDKVIRKLGLDKFFKNKSEKLIIAPKKQSKFTKKDVIVSLAITVFYSIFALTNVGSTKVVETNWTPHSGDSVIIEAEGVFDKLLYLPGIDVNVTEYNGSTIRESRTGANILIEYSNDLASWQELLRSEDPYVYAWQETEIYKPIKFLRITSTGYNTTIAEIGAYYMDNPVELKIIKGEGKALLDEQESVPMEATWENSTYFDEIYHARTAYEYILGAEPYENTHPTLGKLIISLGILIFGMCPFGFRIMGVLFGILMVPLLYRILRRFFDKALVAGGCALIFAFDFMHFTQTRIATIDTYAVFFILLMFNFMISFVSMDVYKEKLSKLLLPLALSGLFMGLGISAKWNVAYAAAGLAVIYFVKIFKEEREENVKLINKRIITLSLFCVVFFVIIPFVIYFASFLVCTLLPQNRTDIFERFIAYQTHMYNYHANLEATHYFASPWYEWPLVIRNIWYYGKSNLNEGVNASTIVCLGNPFIWWSGLASLIILTFDIIRKKAKGMIIILIGFLSAYLPWVIISRLTFIYHYFTAVPFIIMALAYIFNKTYDIKVLAKPIMNKGVLSKIKYNELIIIAFVIIALIMFVIFYPAISGAESSYHYLKSLQWMPDWYFI